MSLQKGETIGAPCEIRPGHFPHERMIAVETEDGPYVGFADLKYLQVIDSRRGFIRGIAVDVSTDPVAVQVFCEFFQSSGFMRIRRELLTRLEA
jgi:hypothetical protein